jgi:hypothetical protein
MTVHSSLNAFSFDISVIEIGKEIKLLEHLKKNWISLYIYVYIYRLSQKWRTNGALRCRRDYRKRQKNV